MSVFACVYVCVCMSVFVCDSVRGYRRPRHHVAQRFPLPREQNVRHHRQDQSAPDFQIPDRERANLPVSMYPDPEVAPHTLVYRINDDLEYQVDIHEFNGYDRVPRVCVKAWWVTGLFV